MHPRMCVLCSSSLSLPSYIRVYVDVCTFVGQRDGNSWIVRRGEPNHMDEPASGDCLLVLRVYSACSDRRSAEHSTGTCAISPHHHTSTPIGKCSVLHQHNGPTATLPSDPGAAPAAVASAAAAACSQRIAVEASARGGNHPRRPFHVGPQGRPRGDLRNVEVRFGLVSLSAALSVGAGPSTPICALPWLSWMLRTACPGCVPFLGEVV